jgi:hypothetical protein
VSAKVIPLRRPARGARLAAIEIVLSAIGDAFAILPRDEREWDLQIELARAAQTFRRLRLGLPETP